MTSSAENAIGPLKRLQGGDEGALAELFEQYRHRLHRIIQARLDPRLIRRVDPDDILQEVYLDAADRIQYYINQHSGSFFVWLRLITTQTMANVFRRHLEAKKRDAKMEISLETRRQTAEDNLPLPVSAQLLGQLTSPSNAAMRDETAKQLEVVIESMKPMDREIIMLRHFELLDNKEVAEVLGIQQKAASIRYIRAISRLRELIAENPELGAGLEK